MIRRIFPFLIVVILVLTGCEGQEGPAGPEGSSLLHVLGSVARVDENFGYVEIEMYNFLDIPEVTINDIPIQYNIQQHLFHYCDFPICFGDSTKLAIDYTKVDGTPGTVRAEAMVPGKVEITSHEEDSTAYISWGDNITVTWEHPPGAEIFSARFNLNLQYEDTLKETKWIEFDLDSLMTETTLAIPLSDFFPDESDVDTLLCGYGHFYIYAINGPKQANDEGNVHGDGEGLFSLYTDGIRFEVEIIAP